MHEKRQEQSVRQILQFPSIYIRQLPNSLLLTESIYISYSFIQINHLYSYSMHTCIILHQHIIIILDDNRKLLLVDKLIILLPVVQNHHLGTIPIHHRQRKLNPLHLKRRISHESKKEIIEETVHSYRWFLLLFNELQSIHSRLQRILSVQLIHIHNILPATARQQSDSEKQHNYRYCKTMNRKPKHLSFYKNAAKLDKKPHKCIIFLKNFKKSNSLS